MSPLRVFVFSAGFGLPTTGPFALKLEFWLRLAGLEYERVYEDDTRKGPKGKNPWIEIDGEPMADTELIIKHLSAERGIDLDSHLTDEQRAVALATTRMVEEHLHQVLEYELFIHDAGWDLMSDFMDESLPWGLRAVVKTYMRSHFRKQLHARGVARHAPEEIAEMGRADLDALEVLIGDGPYLFGDQPCTADASVFGLVAPLVYVPAEAPVMEHASSLDNVRTYCERIIKEWFDGQASERGMARAA
jgi:glutathione S-transferase